MLCWLTRCFSSKRQALWHCIIQWVRQKRMPLATTCFCSLLSNAGIAFLCLCKLTLAGTLMRPR